jgi:hypothetical protein
MSNHTHHFVCKSCKKSLEQALADDLAKRIFLSIDKAYNSTGEEK